MCGLRGQCKTYGGLVSAMISCAAMIGLVTASRLPLEVFEHHPEHHVHNHRPMHHQVVTHHAKPDTSKFKILYQVGKSEEDLPECSPRAVCSKVDLYDTPWLERQCRCSGRRSCPGGARADDGHTLADRTRLYKMCESVKKLPKCRYFRDPTWTLIVTGADNATEQIVHCHCPKNSVTYLIKRQPFQGSDGRQIGYQYLFACSPQSRLRCQRKEPCRLFTVRKRQEFLDEVNMNTLCQCPHSHSCPRHHTDAGVLTGKSYTEEAIRTYSGYCLPIEPDPEE